MKNLQKWHSALRRICKNELLPLGFGGIEKANEDAFHGDKTLSFFVSKAIRETGGSRLIIAPPP